MTIDPAQLLRQLEPAVRPVGPPGRGVTSPLFENRSFDDLLTLVSSGQVASGRPVTSPSSIEPELTDDQLTRLAAAADLAEASGASSALMLLDGRGIVLDVGARAVRSELSPGREQAVVAVDAAVHVTGEPSSEPAIVTGPTAPVGLPVRHDGETKNAT